VIVGAIVFPVGILLAYGTATQEIIAAIVSAPVGALVGYLSFEFWDRI
jgi:hypothetical protein